MAPFLCSHDTFLGHSFQYCHSFWLLCCFEYMTGFFWFPWGRAKKNYQGKNDFSSQLEFVNSFTEYEKSTCIINEQLDGFLQTKGLNMTSTSLVPPSITCLPRAPAILTSNGTDSP